MKPASRLLAFWLGITCVAGFALARGKNPKPGPLTGTWECMSHGGPEGDMGFTLYLEQNEDTVSGSVSSPIGSTELTSASFKKNKLEIHIETPQTNYLLTATYKKGQLSGNWSTDNDLKGTWEGKKSASTSNRVLKKGVEAALCRQRQFESLDLWRDKPAATSPSSRFSAPC